MLFRELLTAELHKQREDFQRFAESQDRDLNDYLGKLETLCGSSSASIVEKIGHKDDAGAMPSEELDPSENFCFNFDVKWENHEQARRWATDVLEKRTTFAADGSQIYAEKDVSLPVGAIQIGWFENPHDAGRRYEKNAYFEILSPQDLLENQEEPMNPETRVGERRFHAEIDKISEFLVRKKNWRETGEKMPLAFFDNTLIFTLSMTATSIEKSFLQATLELVRLSEETGVPVIGYVDRSYARDLLNMLDTLYGRTGTGRKILYDATILHSETSNYSRILKNWGDRTCFCYAKRRGLGTFIDSETGKSAVGFAYLLTTSDNAPVRLDIPSWIYERGLLGEVLNVVRAECVIGLGYPYALETADQMAVIPVRDREIFFRALQDFASREKLGFSVSRKSASKGRRR